MNERHRYYPDVETCVRRRSARLASTSLSERHWDLANQLVNKFFRRAREDPNIDLHICTAATLSRPRGKSELEPRFLEPLSERLFGVIPSWNIANSCSVSNTDLPHYQLDHSASTTFLGFTDSA